MKVKLKIINRIKSNRKIRAKFSNRIRKYDNIKSRSKYYHRLTSNRFKRSYKPKNFFFKRKIKINKFKKNFKRSRYQKTKKFNRGYGYKRKLKYRKNKKFKKKFKSKKVYNKFKKKHKLKYNKKLKLKNKFNQYRIRQILNHRNFLGPLGVAGDILEAVYAKTKRRSRRNSVKNKVSSKLGLKLFKIKYNVLLHYHSPFGKRINEWKTGVQLTNLLLIRNKVSVLNLTTIFFELRKAVNRLFKATKLRQGVAVLYGRQHGWTRMSTFLFDKWLPGFFTNFWLNINELMSYFYKKRCLTRRQRSRATSFKMLNFDSKFLKRKRIYSRYSFDKEKNKLVKRKKKKVKRGESLINYIKLPTVSLSLIDNVCWNRECLKEGISTIQVSDSNTDIEKIDYPLISNQKSLAFLSFISLISKEIVYQSRFWEIKKFKYYAIAKEQKKANNKKRLKSLLINWLIRLKIIRKFFYKRVHRIYNYQLSESFKKHFMKGKKERKKRNRKYDYVIKRRYIRYNRQFKMAILRNHICSLMLRKKRRNQRKLFNLFLLKHKKRIKSRKTVNYKKKKK